MNTPTIPEAVAIVEREWGAQGYCRSCNWHAALYEYGDLADRIYFDEAKRCIELTCLSDEPDGHRGVRIYYG